MSTDGFDDRDRFAVWLAAAVLVGNGDVFAADAVEKIGRRAEASRSLDAELTAARARTPSRGGDLGIAFSDAAVTVALIEFGRILFDAYVKAVAKDLAEATFSAVKELARRTWSRGQSPLGLDDAGARLREAARDAGLSEAQTEKLVADLRAEGAAREIAGS